MNTCAPNHLWGLSDLQCIIWKNHPCILMTLQRWETQAMKKQSWVQNMHGPCFPLPDTRLILSWSLLLHLPFQRASRSRLGSLPSPTFVAADSSKSYRNKRCRNSCSNGGIYTFTMYVHGSLREFTNWLEVVESYRIWVLGTEPGSLRSYVSSPQNREMTTEGFVLSLRHEGNCWFSVRSPQL